MLFSHLFHPQKDLIPILERQAGLLTQSAKLFSLMQETLDPKRWKDTFQEMRSLEHQGDALLTEFREQIAQIVSMRTGPRREFTAISMAMDDLLDVLKDCSNAINIYKPAKIDDQLKELTRIILGETLAIQQMMSLLGEIKNNARAISLQADRVKELEHDADEAYEAYVGHIFSEEPDLREMTKYKNLAELYEKATDSGKHVADCVRILVMRFV
ncbi:MAG: DUF47 family protein [Bacteroidales bacterium]|nr:DUF47 family protein [Bacteroidales bacterium]